MRDSKQRKNKGMKKKHIKKKVKQQQKSSLDITTVCVVLVIVVFLGVYIWSVCINKPVKTVAENNNPPAVEQTVKQNEPVDNIANKQSELIEKSRVIQLSENRGRIELPDSMNSHNASIGVNMPNSSTPIYPSQPVQRMPQMQHVPQMPQQMNNPNPVQTIQDKSPIEPQEPQKKEEPIPPFRTYRFEYNYSVSANGRINQLDLDFMVPSDTEGIQYISNLTYMKKPTNVKQEGVNKIAEYNIENTDRGINVILRGSARVRTYDLKLAKRLNSNPAPETNLARYLRPETHIESADIEILNMASQIEGRSREELVKNIISFVQHKLTYRIGEDIGAKEALTRGYGKCSEFSAATIALCRAKSIPARLVNGYLFSEGPLGGRHAWVEVYYDEYGWVMYDPTTISSGRHGAIIDISDDIPDKNFYISVGRNYFSPGRVRAAGQKLQLKTDPSMFANFEY